MSVEDYVSAIRIQQVLHFRSHTLCFSVLCLEGAVPRRVPSSHQPWSHTPVEIIQVSFQPFVLIRCDRKSREFHYVINKHDRQKRNITIDIIK